MVYSNTSLQETLLQRTLCYKEHLNEKSLVGFSAFAMLATLRTGDLGYKAHVSQVSCVYLVMWFYLVSN